MTILISFNVDNISFSIFLTANACLIVNYSLAGFWPMNNLYVVKYFI